MASGSSSCYGGNPLGAAAGAAALRIIDDEDLAENARVVGCCHARASSRSFVERYPFVGFVQGSGLFLRVELVHELKKTKGADPRAASPSASSRSACSAGLLHDGLRREGFRIQPALTIDEATAMNGLAILAEVFDAVAREGYWREA